MEGYLKNFDNICKSILKSPPQKCDNAIEEFRLQLECLYVYTCSVIGGNVWQKYHSANWELNNRGDLYVARHYETAGQVDFDNLPLNALRYKYLLLQSDDMSDRSAPTLAVLKSVLKIFDLIAAKCEYEDSRITHPLIDLTHSD